jgi:hypothetical protein
MTTFPAIAPNSIGYDLGQLNLSEVATVAGPVRFRHSMQTNGYTLNLNYVGLAQSQVNQIRQHYDDSDGIHRYFDVPAVVWGNNSPVGTDSLYRYVEPPQEEHLGIYTNVTVSLRVLIGLNLLYVLSGGGASQPSTAAFYSFAFTGTSPFILNAGGANPTLTLQGRGASQ